MSQSPVFDWVCAQLESEADIGRLEARGTVRLVLKETGLTPEGVMAKPMAVVLRRLMPNELRARGVDDADGMCERLAKKLERGDVAEPAPGPEAVFRRMGR